MLEYRAFTSTKRTITEFLYFTLSYLIICYYFMWFFSRFPIVTVKPGTFLVGNSHNKLKLKLPVPVWVGAAVFDYLLTNWLAYLYRRIQSPRPDVMPDRRD